MSTIRRHLRITETNFDLQRFRTKAILVHGSVSSVQRFQGYAPLFPNSDSFLLRYQGYAPVVPETNVDLQQVGTKTLLVFGSVSAVQRCQGYARLFPNANTILLRYQGYAPSILVKGI